MPDFCSALDGAKDTKAFVGDRRSTTANSFVPAINIKHNCVITCTHMDYKDLPICGNHSAQENRRVYTKEFFLFGHTGINTAEVYVNHGCR